MIRVLHLVLGFFASCFVGSMFVYVFSLLILYLRTEFRAEDVTVYDATVFCFMTAAVLYCLFPTVLKTAAMPALLKMYGSTSIRVSFRTYNVMNETNDVPFHLSPETKITLVYHLFQLSYGSKSKSFSADLAYSLTSRE